MNEFQTKINTAIFEEMNKVLESLAMLESDINTLAASSSDSATDEIETRDKKTIHLVQDAVYFLWKASEYCQSYVKDDRNYFCDDLYGG